MSKLAALKEVAAYYTRALEPDLKAVEVPYDFFKMVADLIDEIEELEKEVRNIRGRLLLVRSVY